MRKWTHIWYFSRISVEHFHVWHDDGKQTTKNKTSQNVGIKSGSLRSFAFSSQFLLHSWARTTGSEIRSEFCEKDYLTPTHLLINLHLSPSHFSPRHAKRLSSPQKRDPPLRRSSEKGQAGSKAERLFLEKRPNAKERKRKEGRGGWLQALSASYRPMACFQRLAPCPQG